MTKTLLLRFLTVGVAGVLLAADPLGPFEDHRDIGETPQKGKAEFAGGEIRITGGGANIWSTVDAFHYAWKLMPGDVALSADVHFVGTGAVAHRKAALMIRQSLDPGAAYADAALHVAAIRSPCSRESQARRSLLPDPLP
jgi:TolB protein